MSIHDTTHSKVGNWQQPDLETDMQGEQDGQCVIECLKWWPLRTASSMTSNDACGFIRCCFAFSSAERDASVIMLCRVGGDSGGKCGHD